MLDRYIQLLKNGQIVAFPTETVYGLGADAWNPTAIQKVFDQKGRPSDNPLIVHVSSVAMVEDFAQHIPDDARTLMQAFWPGPLTLIFKKKTEVLDLVTAGLDTVAVRWPSHPLSQDLIANVGPLVAPSANSSGRPSPTHPDHIREDFGDDFPIIDAGRTAIGLESTVLDVSQKPYQIYRPGAISAKDIEQRIDKEVLLKSDQSESTAAKSPGTKYSHYAPDATVQWLNANEDPDQSKTLYLLHTNVEYQPSKNIIHFKGDFKKMGRELYDRFRQADHQGYDNIVVEPFSNSILKATPFTEALKNRISKAVS
ncbi:L-threonylcarbamoyladenylate synthase [Fodinibius salsisoli]|uniref:Threonylcarbamoyl-AMP synthase n=1 Tax=Fodinibius salsisoli TaxID=2820877 RepID=A0ABT3PN22_9BACT|nr:L-threonylcarbamoyladenylate synthase [Fodinibius salsisoli]MCW9707343.1 threonylcarbamoyl-AMP synthase [Fodinibius salsisoli]